MRGRGPAGGTARGARGGRGSGRDGPARGGRGGRHRGRGRGRGRGRRGPSGKEPNTADEQTTPAYRPMGASLTIQEIQDDKLTKIARKNWSPEVQQGGLKVELPAFDPKIVTDIYSQELGGGGQKPAKLKRIMLLEISQYLENYLWPHFDADTASFEHVMSIILMLNEKFRENVPPWEGLMQRAEAMPGFFQRVLTLKERRELQQHEKVAYLVFAINAMQSLETEAVRAQVLKLVNLQLWHALSPGRLKLELFANEQLASNWRTLAKREAKAAAKNAAHVPAAQRPEVQFLPGMLREFLEVLESVAPAGEDMETEQPQQGSKLDRHQLLYCERFVEWLTDLLSQLPTRRFVHSLLEDKAILVKCKMSALYSHPQGHLFAQLVDLFQFYLSFPIHNHTGDPLSDEDITAAHYAKVQQLQRLFFKHQPKLRELALANCGTVEKATTLRKYLGELEDEELKFLVTKQLRLADDEDSWADNPDFLMEVMVSTYERRRFQTEVINEMPLYPTEGILWDPNQVPDVHFTGEGCLALPKLNLQFLTFHDYLLRNFNLFRLEATYEIREDIADAISRVGAGRNDEDEVVFRGWARMGLLLTSFSVVEVRKPNVGENKPADVFADIVIDISGLRDDVAEEWEETKQHDVLFLITLRPPSDVDMEIMAQELAPGQSLTPAQRCGLVYVRGCEVAEVKDEEGILMNDFTGRIRPDEWQPPKGNLRTITVALDTAQYQMDMNHLQATKGEDPYSTFNLLMRRKAKENNFKAVLECIRDLMNEQTVVPDWLHDVFLGYGDPAQAQYGNMPQDQLLQTVDFKDTFLDLDHLKESFPGHEFEVVNKSGQDTHHRPFRVTFPPPAKQAVPTTRKSSKRKTAGADGQAEQVPAGPPKLIVESYTPPDPGPYPQDKPPENTVRFTPVQTEAIKSGVQPGLTMVVGPPGTGKTDTAVQIMHVLYHNCPGQRTLLIAHSNQALNDLFEKILQRDVPARYLLRLGMGEQELATEEEFSRVGRVNAMLARRLALLAEVEKLARQFGVAEDVAYTCETAGHFWLMHVLSRWERFQVQVRERGTAIAVQDLFPFKAYFADAPGPLFKGDSLEEDMEAAKGCWRHLRTMFQELEECRAFELLKSQGDRVNYLMTKQAKIVAMTCTHAALKRHEFLDLAFKYDNLLMEESGQILEIETFIPMLLQRQQDGYSRLKRVCLIGDHNQLPPVVKNMAFQKYSHLDQSLFARFVRLGMPYVQLNAQGRARASIAKLYNWRYQNLGDLPHVQERPEFQRANPGFAHEYQFIDVPDFEGRGETEPVPHFYQNWAEAEYLVTVYQYMRLRGYPAERISMLTTYNGQRALLQDVVERRCSAHPAFGRPHRIATVDKYQGQQNDYILLSLVRTRAVGHLRDVRRLVVATSRARLGLYVFGRRELFANCYELRPAMEQMTARPGQLLLHPVEHWETSTRLANELGQPLMVPGLPEMAALVGDLTMQQQAAEMQQQAAAYAANMAAQADAMVIDQPATDGNADGTGDGEEAVVAAVAASIPEPTAAAGVALDPVAMGDPAAMQRAKAQADDEPMG